MLMNNAQTQLANSLQSENVRMLNSRLAGDEPNLLLLDEFVNLLLKR